MLVFYIFVHLYDKVIDTHEYPPVMKKVAM